MIDARTVKDALISVMMFWQEEPRSTLPSTSRVTRKEERLDLPANERTRSASRRTKIVDDRADFDVQVVGPNPNVDRHVAAAITATVASSSELNPGIEAGDEAVGEAERAIDDAVERGVNGRAKAKAESVVAARAGYANTNRKVMSTRNNETGDRTRRVKSATRQDTSRLESNIVRRQAPNASKLEVTPSRDARRDTRRVKRRKRGKR